MYIVFFACVCFSLLLETSAQANATMNQFSALSVLLASLISYTQAQQATVESLNLATPTERLLDSLLANYHKDVGNFKYLHTVQNVQYYERSVCVYVLD